MYVCSVVLKDSSSLRVKQKLQSAKGPTAGRMKSYSGLKQSVVSASNYLHGFSCPLHHQSKDVQLLSLVFSSSELLLASQFYRQQYSSAQSTSCHMVYIIGTSPHYVWDTEFSYLCVQCKYVRPLASYGDCA